MATPFVNVAAFVLSATISVLRTRANSTSKKMLRVPIAKRVAHEVQFGRSDEISALCADQELMYPRRTNIDHYYWMRDDDRKDPEIIGYLEDENKWTQQGLKHTEPMQKVCDVM
jgi:oligopeptidase B